MSENQNDLTFFLEDGRKAEKKVMSLSEDNEQKIITELWTEPKIEKKLTKRIVDYKKPLVYKREVETINEETGELIEKQVESLDADVKVQYKEVPVQTISAQSVQEPIDTSMFATKEDVKGAVAEAVMSLTKVIQKKDMEKPVNSLNYQQLMKQSVESSQNSDDTKGTLGWSIIAVLSAIFVYVTFIL